MRPSIIISNILYSHHSYHFPGLKLSFQHFCWKGHLKNECTTVIPGRRPHVTGLYYPYIPLPKVNLNEIFFKRCNIFCFNIAQYALKYSSQCLYTFSPVIFVTECFRSPLDNRFILHVQKKRKCRTLCLVLSF